MFFHQLRVYQPVMGLNIPKVLLNQKLKTTTTGPDIMHEERGSKGGCRCRIRTYDPLINSYPKTCPQVSVQVHIMNLTVRI